MSERKLICRSCTQRHGFLVVLPESRFPRDRNSRTGLKSICRDCNRRRTREWKIAVKTPEVARKPLVFRPDRVWHGPTGPILKTIRIRPSVWSIEYE